MIGETSAGKTTLINHFVGQKICSTNNVAATATVCRIRDSKTLMLKAYTKDEHILADISFENMTDMRSTIKGYTDISYMKKDIKDTVFYVDIYLPVPILKVFFKKFYNFFSIILCHWIAAADFVTVYWHSYMCGKVITYNCVC